MWDYRTQQVNKSSVLYQLTEKGEVLSFKRVWELWRSSAAFRVFYNQLLANCSFEAYFWEHPPVSFTSINQDYEVILIDSPTLARVKAEPGAFANYFIGNERAVTFANLGGDAQLIVPVAAQDYTDYPHLATFCRNAPTVQIHDFWALVGKVAIQNLTLDKRWLSTSGLGVYWLHIRLDQRPKYYCYQAYKRS